MYDQTFLSGASFLPYQRTGKIKSFAGSLSDHWIASQAELGKKIISRAIELDMKPILPTFSGLVPEEGFQIDVTAVALSSSKNLGRALINRK